MKNFRQEVKQFIREHHRLCYELPDVFYVSAVRTNEFELTRVSSSICLEARIRGTANARRIQFRGEFMFSPLARNGSHRRAIRVQVSRE